MEKTEYLFQGTGDEFYLFKRELEGVGAEVETNEQVPLHRSWNSPILQVLTYISYAQTIKTLIEQTLNKWNNHKNHRRG